MACQRPPVYRELGPSYGHCLLSEINQDSCPDGWTEDGFVKIPFDTAERRGGPFCIQDLGGAIADRSRFRKRCRKVRWDPSFRIPCCLGKVSNPDRDCHPDWCFESRACDSTISNYCKTPAGMRDPACGCLLPQSEYEGTQLFGPPECVDKRCASNPQAYQTERQRNRVCNITNCVIGGDLSIEGENNLDTEIIAQQCGPRFQDLRGSASGNGTTGRGGGVFSSVTQHIRNNSVAYGIGAGVVLVGGLVAGGYAYSQKK